MSWLFPYMGGKHVLADRIVSYLPQHTCYVELFGGSAAVLLAKQSSPIEVYNDLDKEMVNFLLVLRSAGSYRPILDRLVWLCENTPMARTVYYEWSRQDNSCLDPIDRAARWYFLQVCSVNGKPYAGWTHSKQENKAGYWQAHVVRLAEAARRFRNTTIECYDFAQVINVYDGPDTVFYCDPPYWGVKDVAEYYPGTIPLTLDRHKELAGLLSSIQGKAIVSYYPHAVVDELYSSNIWRRVTVQVPKMSQGTHAGDVKDMATELLLFNYDELPLFAALALGG